MHGVSALAMSSTIFVFTNVHIAVSRRVDTFAMSHALGIEFSFVSIAVRVQFHALDEHFFGLVFRVAI